MTTVVQFERAHDFYRAAEALLLTHEAENNLLMGLARAMCVAQDLFSDPYLALVMDAQNAPALAALMTPPQHVILSMAWTAAAADALAAAMLETHPALSGVTAPAAVADYFAEAWAARTGQTTRVTMHERLYKIEHVQPTRPANGHMRPFTQADLPTVAEWLALFEEETFGAERIDRERMARGLMASTQAGVRRYYVWEDGGELTCLVGCSGDTPNGMRIGPVYTPPHLRRRGYATACTAAVTQMLLDEGKKFVALFTDLANLTSNRIYQTIGYTPVVDFRMIRFAPKES
jgi:predicted GNAT family acetyltransferase